MCQKRREKNQIYIIQKPTDKQAVPFSFTRLTKTTNKYTIVIWFVFFVLKDVFLLKSVFRIFINKYTAFLNKMNSGDGSNGPGGGSGAGPGGGGGGKFKNA